MVAVKDRTPDIVDPHSVAIGKDDRMKGQATTGYPPDRAEGSLRNHALPAQDAGRQGRHQPRSDRPVAGEGRTSCCGDMLLTGEDMNATVVLKVGPVKARFEGAVQLSNLNPPHSYTISGEGKRGLVGFAKGGADVTLNERGRHDSACLRRKGRCRRQNRAIGRPADRFDRQEARHAVLLQLQRKGSRGRCLNEICPLAASHRHAVAARSSCSSTPSADRLTCTIRSFD